MFTITHKLRTIVALGAVGTALAGTTLVTAAPAFASLKAPVSTTTTVVYGHGYGAACGSPSNYNDGADNYYGDGTTVTQTTSYSDGTSSTTKQQCENGGWVNVPALSGQPRLTGVTAAASPSTNALAP